MMVANHTIENLAAERFALRDTDKGTNMDYISYASFILANKDPIAFLNTSLLQTYSQKTFQTFFEHFVSSANWTYGGEGSVTKAAYEHREAYWVQSEKFDGIITEHIEAIPPAFTFRQLQFESRFRANIPLALNFLGRRKSPSRPH